MDGAGPTGNDRDMSALRQNVTAQAQIVASSFSRDVGVETVDRGTCVQVCSEAAHGVEHRR